MIFSSSFTPAYARDVGLWEKKRRSLAVKERLSQDKSVEKKTTMEINYGFKTNHTIKLKIHVVKSQIIMIMRKRTV